MRGIPSAAGPVLAVSDAVARLIDPTLRTGRPLVGAFAATSGTLLAVAAWPTRGAQGLAAGMNTARVAACLGSLPRQTS